jgi:hydrogenase maturation factor HypE
MKFDLLVESILDDRKIYRVSHYGLGISEKTTAKDKEEAKRNVFGHLLDNKRINRTDYKKFKDATVREVKHIQEKQMHCWKGYKKKGTKKLPSGKIVNNCVKK